MKKESTSKETAGATTNLFATDRGKSKSNAIEVPNISLPKGGGAIKGIDEKFSVNAINGTVGIAIPIPSSTARGATPTLTLAYSSGGGNGPFGLGWNLSLPSISRKTDNRLPLYQDATDSDTFLFSETEDLVALFDKNQAGEFILDSNGDYVIKEQNSADNLYTIRFYCPRIEGVYARIERWQQIDGTEIKWRVIDKDNTTSLFGWTEQSRLHNPANPSQIFQWLPEFVFDDKGNCCHYVYKKEDNIGVDTTLLHTKNRVKNGEITYTNLYLEKVFYGNKTPYAQFGDVFPAQSDFVFENVFDYGSNNQDAQYDNATWYHRPDAFSHYKAGFEIRTTRLCKRVLLFHHFAEENFDALVHAVDFEYDTNQEQDFTFLKRSVTRGYIKRDDGTYSSKAMPAVDFTYQAHEWNTEVKTIEQDQLIHASTGTENGDFQFIDLYNEGLAGILSEQAGAWFYKQNLGEGKFSQAALVASIPNFVGLNSKLQLLDLDANGRKQLVNFAHEPKGFFELNENVEWSHFSNFKQLPNTAIQEKSIKWMDLNGDGKAELLVSDEESFGFYESLGKEGFKELIKVRKDTQNEESPNVDLSNTNQWLYTADMSGDGLLDLVSIKNGEVAYWPNLGFGKFGEKVTMDDAPFFDHPDAFNPAYLKLADIDGSGTTDIVYLGQNKFTCWKNLSGNRFSAQTFEIPEFPEIHQASAIGLSDLLGNGVACLTWTSQLSKDKTAPLKYIDLMNSKKPHLLIGYQNNVGKKVNWEYKPSTYYYLADKNAGKPWATKLHFPVHCVAKITTEDLICGSKYVNEYFYHHGYYDHAEKEFRGFAMVEQVDAESFENWVESGASNITEQALHQAPVLKKTWVHTGGMFQEQDTFAPFKKEFWHEVYNGNGHNISSIEATHNAISVEQGKSLPPNYLQQVTPTEWQEAIRTCKGKQLRTEIFALDADQNGNTVEAKAKELLPFSVTSNYGKVVLLQPKGKNQHAVFALLDTEKIEYLYDRIVEDPRISQTLNTEFDAYGNILESATVVYPRVIVDGSLPSITQEEQAKLHILFNQHHYSNAFDNNAAHPHTHRLPLACEVKTYEIKNLAKSGFYYKATDFGSIFSNTKSAEVPYHLWDHEPATVKVQIRLIEHLITLYYNNDLVHAMPQGKIDTLGITYESYQLAFTPDLLENSYGVTNTNGSKINDQLLSNEGKFTHLDGDQNWWIRSGTKGYLEAGEQIDQAKARFYNAISFTEPFGTKLKAKFKAPHYLFIEEMENVYGVTNMIHQFNYRTLTPSLMEDINGNFSELMSDELGNVKATAFKGKGNQADDLVGLSEETDNQEDALIQQLFTIPLTADGVTDSTQLTIIAKKLLKNASVRFVQDLHVFAQSGHPTRTAIIAREEHVRREDGSLHANGNDLPNQQNNPAFKIQISFEYSNGSGEVVMKKSQAEPGKAKKIVINNANSINLLTIDTSTLPDQPLRWIGNGRFVKNNKGNIVKQFEPFFSVSNQFEQEKELVETGVSPILYYDALGRLIKTAYPNGTLSRIEFTPWKQVMYDANDTVLESEWYKQRTDSNHPHFINDSKEHEAALKAALHANTPNQLHLDSLLRTVLSVEHTKNVITQNDEFYETKTIYDVEGNLRKVIDARKLDTNNQLGNEVVSYQYDILGNLTVEVSQETGTKWMLNNILGLQIRTWDERMQEFQYSYDLLHRLSESKVIGGEDETPLNNIFTKIIYGEDLLGSQSRVQLQSKNLLGNPVITYDTAGSVENLAFDFKNQAKIIKRTLASNYKTLVNWTGSNLSSDLEPNSFVLQMEMDALGRTVRQISPDGTIMFPEYNEAGLLNSQKVQLAGEQIATEYIKNIDYNEKGQREKIVYGNNVTTKCLYDPITHKLRQLVSTRQNNDPLQDWRYTFDAVGNITHVEDANIPTKFFNNSKITGLTTYTYDALYRLVEATGRENDVALAFGNNDNWNDVDFSQMINNNDPMNMRNYTQSYRYDEVGNILEMKHNAGPNHSWKRVVDYETSNNRLKKTTVGAQTFSYQHHPKVGFMTALPHLEELTFNFREELVKSIRQKRNDGGTPEITYYQYDASGNRIRKITENEANSGVQPTKKDERIYMGMYEIYQKHSGTHSGLVRETFHLSDDNSRFASIEKRNGINDGTEEKLVRYQLSNYMGSSALELNETAQVISYEEYHPFGTTAYQANNASIKAAAKRYKFTGKERDEETGLYYHGARYYLPWLCRWLSPDPIGIGDGVNRFAYAHNSPTMLSDLDGKLANGFYTMDGVAIDKSAVSGGADLKEDNKAFIVKLKEGSKDQYEIDSSKNISISNTQLLDRVSWAYHEGAINSVKWADKQIDRAMKEMNSLDDRLKVFEKSRGKFEDEKKRFLDAAATAKEQGNTILEASANRNAAGSQENIDRIQKRIDALNKEFWDAADKTMDKIILRNKAIAESAQISQAYAIVIENLSNMSSETGMYANATTCVAASAGGTADPGTCTQADKPNLKNVTNEFTFASYSYTQKNAPSASVINAIPGGKMLIQAVINVRTGITTMTNHNQWLGGKSNYDKAGPSDYKYIGLDKNYHRIWYNPNLKAPKNK